MSATPPLHDRIALVTGASRGLGAEIARTLATQGAHVVLAARDERALAAVADEVRAVGREAAVAATDVTDLDEVAAMVAATLERFGRLDLAVNNAGGGSTDKAPIGELDPARFRAELELNLTSVFETMTHEIRAMRDGGGGAIVNVSSGSGQRAAAGMGAYVVAKHGLQGLTKVAALDHADRGIRVNAVAPGPVLAGPLADAGDAFQRRAAEAVPMRRVGRPREVADTVAWLCSDQASFVTGATITIDGGQAAGFA